jgi:predicted dehydrogenase
MDKVKVGIIGVGYLGTQHARILSYLEEAELKGVADIDFKKAMQIGNRHGVQYYENFEEMLDEIDAGIVEIQSGSRSDREHDHRTEVYRGPEIGILFCPFIGYRCCP